MPRKARQAPGGFVYHVLNRAVARLPLFQKDGDFEAFERGGEKGTRLFSPGPSRSSETGGKDRKRAASPFFPGNQTTKYIYGTTLASSGVASTLLKAYEIYPDSVGGSDQVAFTYNIQGEIATLMDQMGTVHEYDYDLLGRKTQDRVTTLGAGVDGSVLRIGTDYEVRGMVQLVTSYDNAGGSSSSSSSSGSGIVNQVQLVYNSFAQLVTEYQSHSGPVITGTTPKVQYGYADGSANTIRPTTMTYPNGRVLSYGYGPSGGLDDAASRIDSYVDNDGVTQLVNYSFLGLNNIVLANSPQPGLEYTLVGIGGGNDPNTGDIYQGLDRFSRVKDLIWLVTGNSSSSSSSSGPGTIVERIQHGYDRAGNRLWRGELADPARLHDELYQNDKVYRLKDLQRGSLTASNSAIVNMSFAQCWSLDETGNWSGFQEDDAGSGVWDLVQRRSSNPANEITVVSNLVGFPWLTPTYDAAGNMSSLPQPGSPGISYNTVHDAWQRLVSIGAGGKTVVKYRYDGFIRRIAKDAYSGGLLTEGREAYFSSNWQVLEERLNSSVNPNRQTVWGSTYVDDPVVRDRDSTGTGGLTERFYAVHDPNGNVTGLISPSGRVAERYAFSGYGTPAFLNPSFAAQSSSSVDWDLLFAGYAWDSDVGLFAVRHRTYHPGLGAWIERDPADLLHFLDNNVTSLLPRLPSASHVLLGGVNLYQYVGSNPLIYVDPFGLIQVAALGVGCGVGGIWGTIGGLAGGWKGAACGFLGGCVGGALTGLLTTTVLATNPVAAGCIGGGVGSLITNLCNTKCNPTACTILSTLLGIAVGCIGGGVSDVQQQLARRLVGVIMGALGATCGNLQGS